MIKSIIKKNFKFYSKLALLIGAFIVFICSFGVSTFAYHEDSNGNLVSDNIFKINDDTFTNSGVNFSCYDNKITLNGTASSSAPVWFTINIPSGTYTIQDFNDFTYNDGFRITLRHGHNNDLVSLYYTTINTYATFTSDVAMDILSISIVNGVTYNNVVLTPTLVSGSIPLKDYEPYGEIYYSQSNYNQAYNLGVNSVFDGLRDFNAIQSYYSISTLFRSTDGGSTYQNFNSLGYTGQYVVDGNLLVEMDDSHDWSYGPNTIYYLDIQFITPIYIANLYLPSIQRPNPVSVQFSDFSYDFNYTMVDGVGYFVTRNIYKITDNLRFYFTAYADMPHEFQIIIKGFNSAIDTYESGFNDGVSSLQSTIDGLNENIHVLENQNKSLNLQLQQGNSSWTSLFFAMADTPFKTASNFLGFEIFGVNLFNALIGFITILAIFWVFKRLIK